jgi:hypothetical protein
MTEAEWQTSTDLFEMMRYVQLYCGTRKLRLLAVACCRCLGPLLRDPDLLEALDAAELYADGQIPEPVLLHWSRRAADTVERLNHPLASPWHMAYRLVENCTRVGPDAGALGGVPSGVSQAVASGSGHSWGTPPWVEAQQVAAKYLHGLVTDVIGNPFWPTVFDPSWRTSDTAGVAGGMYESRDFAAMPILGDALEDAACDNPDILDHCRGPGPHVRGCWLVDLVLAKE